MSKGNPKVVVRMDEDLLLEVVAAMESASLYRFEGDYDLSEWVRKAISEKLAHLYRARRLRKEKSAKGAAMQVRKDWWELEEAECHVGWRWALPLAASPLQ